MKNKQAERSLPTRFIVTTRSTGFVVGTPKTSAAKRDTLVRSPSNPPGVSFRGPTFWPVPFELTFHFLLLFAH